MSGAADRPRQDRRLHARRLLRRPAAACSSRSRPRSGNADIPQAGAYTLNSIAAVVIGGTSLLGGTGGAIGSIFGALDPARHLLLSSASSTSTPLLQPLFEGIILLAAVSLGAVRVLRVKNRLELFR